MQIPLSTILRFGPMGVPKLNPLEPPLFSQDFSFYEVSVMFGAKVTNDNLRWHVVDDEERENGIYEVVEE